MTPANRWSRSAIALLVLALFPGAAASLGAQGWSVSAAAGRIVHEGLGDRIGTAGTTLGITYDGPQWLYITGGFPFDAEGVPWGAVGAGGRVASAARTSVGIDLVGQFYGFRERQLASNGSGATLEAMPLVALGWGDARLEMRSGIRYHTSAFAGESDSRRVHQSDARLGFAEQGFRVTGEGRLVRAEEASYPYLGGEVEATVGQATVWGSAGKWLADDIDTPVWGAGAFYTLGRMGGIFASVQQETSDPLYRQSPRRSWSIGLSRRLGSVPAAEVELVLVPEILGDQVTFRLPAEISTDPPGIGGDFTGWDAVPMRREANFWTVTVPVPAGVHRYAFREADGDWFVPEWVPGRMEDGFGGHSATLVVP